MSITKILKLSLSDFFSTSMIKMVGIMLVIPLAICILIGFFGFQYFFGLTDSLSAYQGFASLFVNFIAEILPYFFVFLFAIVLLVFYYILVNLTLVFFVSTFSENFITIINNKYYQLPKADKVSNFKIFFVTLKVSMLAYFYIAICFVIAILPLFIFSLFSFNLLILLSLFLVVYTNRMPIVLNVAMLFQNKKQYPVLLESIKGKSRMLCWILSPISLIPILNLFLPALLIISQTHLILSEIKTNVAPPKLAG